MRTQIIDRTTDVAGRPLILWRRHGDRRRRRTGWDAGRVWTVQVPSRLKTAKKALDWLQPLGISRHALRQGEWYFDLLRERYAALCCEEAWCRGSYIYQSESDDDWGNHYTIVFRRGTWTGTRHRAECVVVAQKTGEAVFRGRKGWLRVRKYASKPRLFVRGRITAPGHPDLVLDDWREVIGNRAVGAPVAIATGLVGGGR